LLLPGTFINGLDLNGECILNSGTSMSASVLTSSVALAL